jgi:hypothetical protein
MGFTHGYSCFSPSGKSKCVLGRNLLRPMVGGFDKSNPYGPMCFVPKVSLIEGNEGAL